MIIFAKHLRERPTECMSDALFVTLRHTHCPTTERILDQILTYMIAVLEKYKMHHKGKETEMLNTNMFAFNHTRLHYT